MNFWHRLPRPIIGLAPMDGVTDSVFRRLIVDMGKPDVIFTEFTNVRDICQGRGANLDSLRYSEHERPIVAQLYGKDPERFFQAAHVVCALGFDGLDINMGCPSKNVASSGSGAALIRTPELAIELIAAARRGIQSWAEGRNLTDAGLKPFVIESVEKANRARQTGTPRPAKTPIPLSVKTRLGYDEDIIEEWSQTLIQARPDAISIHGRTLSQMYRGRADWDAIARAARRIRSAGILVLGNGDVASLEKAALRIQETAVQGVLLGRAALGNPWLFRNVSLLREHMSTGKPAPIPEAVVDLPARFQIMIEHARRFEALHGKERFPSMRKHLGWYCTGFPHAAAMRGQMVRTTCAKDVQDIVMQYQETSTVRRLPLLLAGSGAPLTAPVE